MATHIDNEICEEGPSEITSSTSSSPQESINVQNLLEKFGQDVTIVFVGRSGAGKSTLASNITDKKEDIELTLSPTTKECGTKKIEKGDASAYIVDTPGLQGEMIEQLRKMSMHTKSQANIIVYCLSINPGAKFHAEDSSIMQALQDTYGLEIWKRCIIILTFSNMALEHCNKKYTIMESVGMYKKYVNRCAARFQRELTEHLGVESIDVKTIFEEIDDESKTTIVAIPAGFVESDKVLPDYPQDWKGMIFYEFLKKCKGNEISDILRDKYLRNRINKAVNKYGDVALGATGGGTGVVVGAGLGGVVGAAGGPAGVVVGGLVGATVGVVAGAGFSAAAAGVKKLRSNNSE